MIAALSAVFSLRQDLTTSVTFGKSRIIGNTFGGLFAILYFFIRGSTNHGQTVQMFVLPILVVLFITFSVVIKNESGIVGGLSALLIISLNVQADNSVAFAVARVLDTFIGTAVAVALNLSFLPKPKEEETEIDEDIAVLERKERELEELKKKIEEKRLLDEEDEENDENRSE